MHRPLSLSSFILAACVASAAMLATPGAAARTTSPVAQASEPAKTKKARQPQRERRGTPYAGNEQAMQLADAIAQRRGLDAQWTRDMVGQAQNLAVVSRLMQPAPSGTPKNWRVYRSRFIDA
ncbi:MAG: hypothetical protein EOO24_49240, partial [Comamonadaceae bacterium]